MQVEGDVDTVTELSGSDIEALNCTNGDLVKLRIIQASTAKNTTVNFPHGWYGARVALYDA